MKDDSVTDDVVADAGQTAAALVCAVADRDRDEVRRLLTKLGRQELYALAVVLAAYVPDDTVINCMAPMSPARQVDVAITEAAALFATDRESILAHDRHRHVLEARAVAMASLRLVGLSSPYIGERFKRDHSTVLNAAGRVGENPRLRRIALGIADQIGDRGLLAHELQEAKAS